MDLLTPERDLHDGSQIEAVASSASSKKKKKLRTRSRSLSEIPATQPSPHVSRTDDAGSQEQGAPRHEQQTCDEDDDEANNDEQGQDQDDAEDPDEVDAVPKKKRKKAAEGKKRPRRKAKKLSGAAGDRRLAFVAVASPHLLSCMWCLRAMLWYPVRRGTSTCGVAPASCSLCAWRFI